MVGRGGRFGRDGSGPDGDTADTVGRLEGVGRAREGLFGHLGEFLQGFGAPPEDVRLVRRTLSDTRDLFLLVVGEFNAGKSAFVSALLAEKVSGEGTIPTTVPWGVGSSFQTPTSRCAATSRRSFSCTRRT